MYKDFVRILCEVIFSWYVIVIKEMFFVVWIDNRNGWFSFYI